MRRPSRLLAALGASATSLVAPVAAMPPAAHARRPHDAHESAVISELNAVRARYGLPAVVASRGLAGAAARHSRDQLRHDYVSHAASDGAVLRHRLRPYDHARTVGEVIAYAPPAVSGAQTIVAMWMGSPSHRRVVLSRRLRRIGVGRATGALAGSLETVVTADLASTR